MDRDEVIRLHAIEFSLKMWEQTAACSNAQARLLDMLCPDKDWKSKVAEFTREAVLQIRPQFDMLRAMWLPPGFGSSQEPPLPKGWKEIVQRLVESGSEPDSRE
jgi:hypothetical protein